MLAALGQAAGEIAMALWVAQFLISLPAQVLAWGGISWSEPRVSGAIWIIGLTGLLYIVGRWMGERVWMSLAMMANAAVVVIVLRGAINLLHPFNPILGSDSPEIILFYAGIVLTVVAFATVLTWPRSLILAERTAPS